MSEYRYDKFFEIWDFHLQVSLSILGRIGTEISSCAVSLKEKCPLTAIVIIVIIFFSVSDIWIEKMPYDFTVSERRDAPERYGNVILIKRNNMNYEYIQIFILF